MSWKKIINKIYKNDALELSKQMPDNFIDMIMTSPPYWALRDYGVENQFGIEKTLEEYIDKLCNLFDILKAKLKKEGSIYINMGDVYGGTGDKGQYVDPKSDKRNGQKVSLNRLQKSKCLLSIPARFQIEMINRGWILRNIIIWHKPNCFPTSTRDRYTVDFEYLFFFVKNKKYYFQMQHEPFKEGTDFLSRKKLRVNKEYDCKEPYKRNMPYKHDLIKKRSQDSPNRVWNDKESLRKQLERGRHRRCIWSINTKPHKNSHVAVYPEELCRIPILSSCPVNGIVLDPFCGSGTTLKVANDLNRNYIGFDIKKEYVDIAKERLNGSARIY